MKVILLEDLPGTGKKDQIIEVSDGYARNFLLPRKKALEATATQLNAIKTAKAAQVHKRDMERQEALAQAERFKELTVTVPVKAGSAGRLFGAVTSQEVSDALKAQHGIELDKRKVVIADPIKSLGEAKVSVKLYPEISASLKLNIVAAE